MHHSCADKGYRCSRKYLGEVFGWTDVIDRLAALGWCMRRRCEYLSGKWGRGAP
jgi:hypothetical protein